MTRRSGSGRRRGTRRVLAAARILLVAAFAVVGYEVISANSDELSGVTDLLTHLQIGWALAALAAECVAYMASTLLQGHLLKAGGASVGFTPLLAINLAGNAINVTLPGGGALATVFAYRQLRRHGADAAVTTWTVVAFAALTSLSLAGLALVGLIISGPEGPVGGLWPLIGLLIVGPLLGGAVLFRPSVLARFGIPVVAAVRRLTGRPRRTADDLVLPLVQRLEVVEPRRRDLIIGAVYALANWVADCTCLLAAFLAVGAAVPWRGLLVAYGAAQVASNVPITPGGLGVVEGSLAVALVAYGGATGGTVAAVVVYRLVSFWIAVALGWLCWLALRVYGPPEAAEQPDVEAVAVS